MGPLQAAAVVNILQGWERTSADPLGSVDPLEPLPFRSGAAAEPQYDTVAQHRLDGAPVKGHQQSVGEVVFP